MREVRVARSFPSRDRGATFLARAALAPAAATDSSVSRPHLYPEHAPDPRGPARPQLAVQTARSSGLRPPRLPPLPGRRKRACEENFAHSETRRKPANRPLRLQHHAAPGRALTHADKG